jgi:multiple sugar transport system ATP-binding protein
MLDVAPESRNMAMAFENYALYSHMSVCENLAFPLRAKKLSRQEIDERVQRISRILQISDLLDRRPGFLSGGQRQRVALGRAIIRPATIYLLDEPIGHLDAKLRHRMRGELKAMAADLNATVALVTTSSREALALADRIAILRNGILEQIGTPNEIYHRPQNEFVASFVGEPPMSFLNVEPTRVNGQLCLQLEGLAHYLPLSAQVAASLNGDQTGYRLGVRASEMSIAGQEDEQHHTPGEVYVIEPMGYCNIISIKVGDGLVRAVVDPTVRPQSRETVWLSLDCADIHLFHAQKAISHPSRYQEAAE